MSVKILYCATAAGAPQWARVRALSDSGYEVCLATGDAPTAESEPPGEQLWLPVTRYWRGGLAIRAAARHLAPRLILLEDIRVPPVALTGVAADIDRCAPLLPGGGVGHSQIL